MKDIPEGVNMYFRRHEWGSALLNFPQVASSIARLLLVGVMINYRYLTIGLGK